MSGTTFLLGYKNLQKGDGPGSCRNRATRCGMVLCSSSGYGIRGNQVGTRPFFFGFQSRNWKVETQSGKSKVETFSETTQSGKSKVESRKWKLFPKLKVESGNFFHEIVFFPCFFCCCWKMHFFHKASILFLFLTF